MATIIQNLKAFGKTFWANATASKITTTYTIMSLVYCFFSIVFLFQSYSVSFQTSENLVSILGKFNLSGTDFTHLNDKTMALSVCSSINQIVAPALGDCVAVWPPAVVADQQLRIEDNQFVGKLRLSSITPNVTITIRDPKLDENSPRLPTDPTTTISPQCALALKWPTQQLKRHRREDITFICYQFWVVIMSLSAIYAHSIPHIVASFITHVISAGWAIGSIFQTRSFERQYIQLITSTSVTKPGACPGLDLIPQFFGPREQVEIGIAVLNGIAFFMSAFLSWKLYRLFGWSMFKRMGASILINRLYRIALSTFVSIHLTAFFMIAIMTLWIDQLLTGFLGSRLAVHLTVYLVVYFTCSILLPPWAYMAWNGVRRERRVFMLFFYGLSLVFMGGTWTMMLSETFRATFIYWRFFSLISTAAFIGIFITTVLGILARLGFGKGLPMYMEEESADSDESFRPTPDVEKNGHKIDFPGHDNSIQSLHRTDSNTSSAYAEEKVNFPGGDNLSRSNTFDSFSFDNRPMEVSPVPPMYDPPRRPSANSNSNSTNTSAFRSLYPQRSFGSKSASSKSLNPFESSLDRRDTISSFGPRGDDAATSVGGSNLSYESSFGSVQGDRQALERAAAARQAQLKRNETSSTTSSTASKKRGLDLGEELGGSRF